MSEGGVILVEAPQAPPEAPAPAPAVDPLKCPDCGKGPFASDFALRGHRTTHTKGKPSAERRAQERAEGPQPVTAALGDLGRELRPGARGAPSFDETNRVLGRILLYISIFLALWLISDDPGIQTDDERRAALHALQLTTRTAQEITHPISRFVQPTKIWREHGRKLVEHSDVFDALAGLYEWGSSIAKYRRDRARREGGELPPSGPPPGYVAGPTPPPGYAPAPTGMREGILATGRHDLNGSQG